MCQTPHLEISFWAGKSSLSGGAIAGIVVGVLAAVAIAALAALFLIQKRRSRNFAEVYPLFWL